MKQTYYFQIPEIGKAWDKIVPLPMEFTTRADAVNAAKLLSMAFGKEIRWADNPNYKFNGGNYTFAPKPKS